MLCASCPEDSVPCLQPPRIQPLPPLQPDWRLQDDVPVTKELYHLVDNMITLMNEVIDDLPELAS